MFLCSNSDNRAIQELLKDEGAEEEEGLVGWVWSQIYANTSELRKMVKLRKSSSGKYFWSSNSSWSSRTLGSVIIHIHEVLYMYMQPLLTSTRTHKPI